MPVQSLTSVTELGIFWNCLFQMQDCFTVVFNFIVMYKVYYLSSPDVCQLGRGLVMNTILCQVL